MWLCARRLALFLSTRGLCSCSDGIWSEEARGQHGARGEFLKRFNHVRSNLDTRSLCVDSSPCRKHEAKVNCHFLKSSKQYAHSQFPPSIFLTYSLVPVETALYDILGVDPSATEGKPQFPRFRIFLSFKPDEIKKAYRKKVSVLPLLCKLHLTF